MKHRRPGSGQVVTAADYRKRIIFDQADFPDSGHLLQVVTVDPGTTQRPHFHSRQTEVFFILEGRADLTFDGRTVRARPGDAFICSPGEVHNVHTEDDCGATILVFKLRLPSDDADTIWAAPG